jgi:alkyl sulfatase BDS1-like metallo-beta-lactamase superfamily hydrolase
MTEHTQPLGTTFVRDGEIRRDAVSLGKGIFMSSDISNVYRVLTKAGDVLINTGISYNEKENLRRLSAVSANPIRKIILTQSHADYTGGWSVFNAPGIDTIVQANYAYVRGYWAGLGSAMARRSRCLWGGELIRPIEERPEPIPTIMFFDEYHFELGGRRFALYSTPAGDSLDSLIVCLPQEGIVFAGNLMGSVLGSVPNLFTVSGDKTRSIQRYIQCLQLIINLGPEVLITGHDEAVRGREEIRRRVTRIRDAIRYIKDETFKGMNLGIDLWTLMDSIKLPAALTISESHGKVSWLVRAIWEEYLGWFRHEATTELYNVPASTVSPDLVELAGGTGPVVERAQRHLSAGRPLEALHLVDAALTADPSCLGAKRAKLMATEMILEECGRENFSEVRWLESEIRMLRQQIEAGSASGARRQADGNTPSKGRKGIERYLN